MIESEFKPVKKIAETYSLENISKRSGMSIEEFKLKIDKELQNKKSMIEEQLKKGLTQEQAECHVMRCLYISGFSGPTFKD